MNDTTALLIIDVQVGLDDPWYGVRNNPGAEARLASLLAAWREGGWPVVHVQHLSQNPRSPLRPGQPGVELKPEVRPAPGEPLFQKTVNSAFIGTDLEAHLRSRGITRLVIGGLTTDHCISSSVRMAANLGFAVTLVSDATAAFGRTSPSGREWSGEDLHDAALTELDGEFATVRTTAELLRAASTP